MESMTQKSKILIVDDQPKNITILSEILKGRYIPMAATNGPKALEYAVSGNQPDLILLDIMMPGMDGYEVCRRLKMDEKTRDIPVIFITALDKAEDECKGFDAGCVDFITKPFNSEVVEARVRRHLECKQYRDHLEKLTDESACQLMHAERLASLGSLSAGIAHEISNYMYILTGRMELLQDEINDILPFLVQETESHLDNIEEPALLFDRIRKSLDAAMGSGQRMVSILGAMKRLARESHEENVPVSIADTIENALELCKNSLKTHVEIRKNFETSIPAIWGNSGRLEQVFINLFKNAADAIETVGKGVLEISASLDSKNLRIEIADTGPGIQTDKLETVWKPFFTTKDSEKGLGLGLSITKKIIESHNGTISAENRVHGGARFIIEFPVCN